MRQRGVWMLAMAVLGGAAGAALGWPAGWAVVQLSTALFFAALLRRPRPPLAAASLAAAFAAGFEAAGHLGSALAVPATLGWLGWLVYASLVLGAAAVAAVLTGFAWRLPVTPPLRAILVLPAAWVLAEALSLQVDLSVPWLAIGHAHADGSPLGVLFALGGVHLAGGVSLAISAALAWAWTRPSARRATALPVTAAVALLSLALIVADRFDWTTASGAVQVELLQTGAPPADAAAPAAAAAALRGVMDAVARSDADLLVTPQLALPRTLEALPQAYLAELDARLRRRHADAVVGVYAATGIPDQLYNAALAIGSSGQQLYLKHDLLPFGEALPLGPLNPWLRQAMARPVAATAPGPVSRAPLHLAGLRVAPSICYEALFGDRLRERALGADLLLNMASDSGLASPQLARQFRQIAQARARELQKPLLRSSDIRGSFVLGPRGEVLDELPPGGAGRLSLMVTGRQGLTPYARWGNAMPVAVLALAWLVVGLWAWAGRAAWPSRRSRLAAGPAGGAGLAWGTLPVRPLAQRGQVLPVSVGLVVIISLFFYLMVNAGQAVTEKIRVDNAADAAAYSAGTVEARALNFDAYMNRAVIANQMAIAQMVSFASWLQYFANASDNFGANMGDLNFFLLPNPDVAVLDIAFGGSAVVAAYFGGDTVTAYTDEFIDYVSGPLIAISDAASVGAATTEMFVQANLTLGIRQTQIAKQIVQAMDPKLDAEVVLPTHGFDTFTKSWSDDDRQRLKDVTMASRDNFVRERNFTVSSFGIPFLRRDPALKKRGGTDMIGFDEWRGIDTLELHGERFGCGRFGLSWCGDVQTPIGWGGIEVDAGGGDAGRGYHGNAYGENGNTANRAESVMRSPAATWYSGLPAVREIANPTSDPNEAPPVTGVTVRVWKSQSDTLTSGGAATLKPSGDLQRFDAKPAKGIMVGMARAEVFFDRISPRADGKTERGSLYNPYWRVRLVAPTVADQAYAAARQDMLVIPRVPTP